MSAQLLVLAKRPEPGRVKTRLCPPCSPGQASTLAAASLTDTLNAVRHTPVARRVLAVDKPVVASGFDIVRQRGDGLGARIAYAFADAAATVADPILQLGMDTPQITPALLGGCLGALLNKDIDAVLGPAEDGGWWALGLRVPGHAALLREVPMSTADTGRLTLATLESARLRVTLLPTLRDVDAMDDARAVAKVAPESLFAVALESVVAELHATAVDSMSVR